MKTIEHYIIEKDARTAGVVGFLRELILSCSPTINEEISYGLPFYYYHGRLCYINAHDDGVELGFCRGKEIKDPYGLLEPTDRNDVKSVSFKSVKNINPDKVIALIYQALLINEQKAAAHKAPSPVIS